MEAYFSPEVDWDTLKSLGMGLTAEAGRFDSKKCWEKLRAKERFDPDNLKRYALYPFDVRWCYHTISRPLWNEPRPDLTAQQWEGNAFLVTRKAAERPGEQHVTTLTMALPDHHLLRPNVVAIPIRIRQVATSKDSPHQQRFFSDREDESPRANLSEAARAYLENLKIKDFDESAESAELIWMHVLAITYSPAYLKEHRDGIRLNWPRIPMPSKKGLLLASAELGRSIASLLEPEREVEGVTSGSPRPEFKGLGVPKRVDGKQLNLAAGDLNVTQDWGRPTRTGTVMPGPGKWRGPRLHRDREEATRSWGRRSEAELEPDTGPPGVENL